MYSIVIMQRTCFLSSEQRSHSAHAENGIQGFVETVENQKGKIELHISINATEEVFEMLKAHYKILIS